jgi:hypothetical protein
MKFAYHCEWLVNVRDETKINFGYMKNVIDWNVRNAIHHYDLFIEKIYYTL